MRLFIADGNSSVRLALQMYLQQEPGMYVTGMASTAQGLSAQVQASRPHVLILDSQLPGGSLQDTISEIGKLEFPPKIVVLYLKPEEKETALASGADAFISKRKPPQELQKAVLNLR